MHDVMLCDGEEEELCVEAFETEHGMKFNGGNMHSITSDQRI